MTDADASADDRAALLAAYDAQLRTDAETPSAVDVTRLGPLRLVTFRGGRGFVTYRDLGGADAAAVRGLVGGALAHYRADPAITRVEWKTRGHDEAPGLHEALVEHGFVADEPESIMIGEAGRLAVDVPLPEGVTLRRVTSEADVRAMSAMADEGFGDPVSTERADAVLAPAGPRRRDGAVGGRGRRARWSAPAGSSRSPAPSSPGSGAARRCREWRGRGIYRALTAARARSALRLGKRLIHSDSTEFSRPILERSGLVKVSTTTPYEWRR